MSAPLWTDAERRLLPVLPMVYVAWADEELTRDELQAIRTASGCTRADDEGMCGALEQWLDPEAPPDAGQLQDLLMRIRQGAASLHHTRKLSLVELGLALAAQHPGDSPPSSEETQALRALEQALGLYSPRAAAELLPWRAQAVGDPTTSTLRVDALQRLLEGDFHEDRARVRELLEDPRFRHRYGMDKETQREWVLELTRAYADAGLADLAFPECSPHGHPGRFMAMMEALAVFDLSLVIKAGVQFGLFGGSIYFLGSDAQRRELLPQVTSLRLAGCFAMTELGHGSNVRELGTTARYEPDGDHFVVHTPSEGARKEWIGNAAAHGRLATVFAQLEVDGESHGVHALLVPIRDENHQPAEGVRIADCGLKLGLNGVDNGRLWFDHVRVPRANLLSRFAQVDAHGKYHSDIASPARRFFTMIGTLVGGRVSIAAASVQAAGVALAIALRYGARRRQFGPAPGHEVAILDYPTHQQRLMPLLAINVALRFALTGLRARYVDPDDHGQDLEGEAAGLKAMATWMCTETVQTCRECCGGQGYAAVNRFAALKADTDVFTTFEGDNTVLMQLLAKGLLTSFRKQFSDNRLLGFARYLGEQASRAVAERNPIIARLSADTHLRSHELQGDLLRAREAHILGAAASRLQHHLGSGAEPFEAFTRCQVHLVALGKAHTERLVFERFNAAVLACQEADLRGPLVTLRDLFALQRIRTHSGWFLENGYIEPVKAKAIRRQVERLCSEAREHALGVVQAFAIPATALAAPIAMEDPARSR